MLFKLTALNTDDTDDDADDSDDDAGGARLATTAFISLQFHCERYGIPILCRD